MDKRGVLVVFIAIAAFAVTGCTDDDSRESSGTAYERDARACAKRHEALPSTAFAVALTNCMKNRGHRVGN